jgi:hypothetical protein
MKSRCILASILTALVFVAISCTALAQSTLNSHRKRWETHNIQHYRYTLRMYCLCPYTESVNIEVRNGLAVSVLDWSGAPSSGDIIFSQYFDHADTVDKLFGVIEGALAQGADDVSVDYDNDYGYPTHIYIDFYRAGHDDEISYFLRDFEVLE